MMAKASIGDIVDAHFHLWYCPGQTYTWPTTDLSISKEKTIEQYIKASKLSKVNGAVYIQVLNNSVEEIEWVSKMVSDHNFIKGIVGGIDPSLPEFETKLAEAQSSANGLLKGVRHILDLESDGGRAWLNSDEVRKGMKVLQDHNLTFDLLLRPPLVRSATELVREFPKLKFVVDHIAKPHIKSGVFDNWAEDMKELSQCPNVWCKISGLVTEADYENNRLTVGGFVPFVKHIVNCFGTDRLMFGSDWPVCQLAGKDHEDISKLALVLFDRCDLSNEDKVKVMRDNCIKFYGLNC